MTVSLYGNTCQENALASLFTLISELLQAHLSVEIESEFHAWLLSHGIPVESCISTLCPSSDSTVIISAGGDGTLLKAVRWSGSREIPVAGINTGHLGFLTAWHMHDAHALVQAIANESINIESRTILQVICAALPPDVWPFALNDVSILKENSGSMISVRTALDDSFLTDYEADGLLIATPSGSTAYNLSAGGPILQPSLPGLVLTPVAPHTLTMRPLVVSDSSHIITRAHSRTGSFLLGIDGAAISLPSDTEIEVVKAPFSVKLVHSKGDGFAAALREKLLWGTPLRD